MLLVELFERLGITRNRRPNQSVIGNLFYAFDGHGLIRLRSEPSRRNLKGCDATTLTAVASAL
jgi:hypothetical protein